MQVNEPSWRKPVGMILILLLLGVWCVAVVVLVEALELPLWASALPSSQAASPGSGCSR